MDSDDVALPDRVITIRKRFDNNPEINCIYHNAYIIDENGKVISDDFFKTFNQKDSLRNILLKTTFFGACMAFRNSFLS